MARPSSTKRSRRCWDPTRAHPVQTLLAKRDHDRPGNELAALRGVRFVSASEPVEGARLDVALVKALTGKTLLPPGSCSGSSSPTSEVKLWLMTNHRPVIRETTNAIWDRVKLIPFDVRFYADGEDAPANRTAAGLHASHGYAGELPGILAWAVRGCLAWSARDSANPRRSVPPRVPTAAGERSAGSSTEVCRAG